MYRPLVSAREEREERERERAQLEERLRVHVARLQQMEADAPPLQQAVRDRLVELEAAQRALAAAQQAAQHCAPPQMIAAQQQIGRVRARLAELDELDDAAAL